MSLLNKVALVTGASSGIGAAITELFAKEGANVVMVGRNETKLKNVSDQCKKVSGRSPHVIVADVSKDEDAKKIIKGTVEHFGKLDILVNNAGIGGLSSIETDDAISVFDKVMNTNLRALVILTHLAVPHLTKTKGNIVNISSIAGILTMEKSFAYCTSKASVDHFTRSVAKELGVKGVRANTINPGPVKTDIMENMGLNKEYSDMVYEKFTKSTVLNRISGSEEVADLALFLASEKAKGITGSSFVTDNGVLLNGST